MNATLTGAIMKLEVRSYERSDEAVVVQLWQDCALVVPWNDPLKDIERKMKVQPDLFLVGCLDSKLVATVMAGYDGHRGWINYLGVAPVHQGKGIGRQMMDEAEARLRALGCPKINLQVRGSNAGVIEFYKSLGFKEEDRASFGKRLEEDERPAEGGER